MQDEYLTYQQAAEYLGVSYQTVRNLVVRKGLAVYHPQLRKHPKLVKRADLDALREIVPNERREVPIDAHK